MFGAFQMGVTAADAHTIRLIKEYNAGAENMLTYIMKKEGLWDSYKKEQDDNANHEASLHGAAPWVPNTNGRTQ
jgi:hypothetical protein